jgi:hypothetical protein
LYVSRRLPERASTTRSWPGIKLAAALKSPDLGRLDATPTRVSRFVSTSILTGPPRHLTT